MAKTPKARALGAALRQAREDTGLKLRELAMKIDRDAGVVSRWETGERTPKPEHVAQILTTLGIKGPRYEEILSLAHDPDAPLWVATTLPAQRQQLAALVECEQSATRITEVAPLLIPGLLQTDNYARAIMSGGGWIPQSEVITRVAIRMARRDTITRADPVDFIALVGEPVLHHIIGSRDIMLEQFKHLLQMSRRRNVEFRVYSFDSGWHPALEGAFDLIETDSGIPVVQLETRTTPLFLHEDADVKEYQRAVEMVHQASLPPDVSLSLVRQVISRMES